VGCVQGPQVPDVVLQIGVVAGQSVLLVQPTQAPLEAQTGCIAFVAAAHSAFDAHARHIVELASQIGVTPLQAGLHALAMSGDEPMSSSPAPTDISSPPLVP